MDAAGSELDNQSQAESLAWKALKTQTCGRERRLESEFEIRFVTDGFSMETTQGRDRSLTFHLLAFKYGSQSGRLRNTFHIVGIALTMALDYGVK